MRHIRGFRDPVHTTISFDLQDPAETLALRLIDTPELQRLRHVRQLGLANLVYHGVEHSRFSHTLGVMHLARRFFRSALDILGEAVDNREYALVLAAAVLHDVGHAPFSHALEKVLGVRHEKVSVLVIKDDTNVHRLLSEFGGDKFVEDVADHIEDASDKRSVSVISSQLDADRADYILRDGYYAGIPNAQFDLERIVQKTRLDSDGLIFEQSAQQAIEGYFIARYHLYIQLYYHRTVRSAEALLRAAIRRARDLRADGRHLGEIGMLKRLFAAEPDLNLAARLTDEELWAAFRYWAVEAEDRILRDLSHRLVNRQLFKAEDFPAADVAFAVERLPAIKEVAGRRGLEPDYYVLFDTAKDTPYKLTDPTAGSGSKATRLRGEKGEISALEVRSGIVKALQDEAYQMNRVCFPEEIRHDVRKIISG